MFNSIYKEQLPHTFSIQMGNLIREAREQKGWSQKELAERIYKRRPSVSDMENGKMLPSLETLYYLALNLDKPLIYFVPPKYQQILHEEPPNTSQEKELLIQFRRLTDSKQQQLAINQIKAMADLEDE